MRTLAIGDVHSGLKALEQLLKRAEVTHEDHLIFLGDYVDSWSDAYETILFLIELGETHRCTFIRGNHDELCKEWMLTGNENPQWLAHGGKATRDSFIKAGKKNWSTHLDFFDAMQSTYLDTQNRLFLHAGFTNLKGIEHEYFEKSFYWDRTLWELVKALDPNLNKASERYPKRLTHYREIFIGHTPISKTGHAEPEHHANVWNLDTGAAFKGPLTIMDVDTKAYWQSDPVYTFYRNENGRN